MRNPRTHRYSTSRGIPACAAPRRPITSGVSASRSIQTEIVVTLGSKEGLANLAQAITAPGDVILAPNPSYPIHPYGFIIAGAAIRHVPLVPGADLMAELAHAAEHSVPPPTAIVLNFPSNPTGLVVDLDFYREVVSFARRRDILLLSDLAYAEIYFAAPPPSILQVPGAKDVAVEFTSLSKPILHARLAHRLCRRQRAVDRGAHPDQVVPGLRRVHADPGGGDRRAQSLRRVRRREPHRYRERRDVLVEGLCAIGWPVPSAARDHVRVGADRRAISRARLARVQQAPAARGQGRGLAGLGFGEYGEGFVRFALVENRQRIRQAVRNIRTFLGRRAPERARAVAWPMAEPLRLGIAGLGTVGAVLRLLAQNGSLVAERAGRELEVTAVSARHRAQPAASTSAGSAGTTTRSPWRPTPRSMWWSS